MAIKNKPTIKKGGKGGKEKKKRPKGEKGVKVPKITDGLLPSLMSKGQLMLHIKRLLGEIEMERTERNLFILEKQKLLASWNLAMDRNKTLKDETDRFLAIIDTNKRKKRGEEAMYNQKLRYLQNEEMKTLGIIRLNHLNYMRHISDEMWETENILRESAVMKRQRLRQLMGAQYEIIRGLYAAHAKKLQEMILTMSKSLRSKEIKFDREWEYQKEHSTTKLTENNSKIFNLKLGELDTMNTTHDKMFLDLQTFFNDMTTNNHAVIHTVENEVERQKIENSQLNHHLKNVQKEYKKLVEELEKYQQELSKPETKSLKNLSLKFQHLRRQLMAKEKCVSMKELLNETLIQQIEQEQRDENVVEKECVRGIVSIQRQLNMEGIVNNLKFKSVTQDLTLLKALKNSFQSEDHQDLITLHNSQQSRIRTMKENLRHEKFGRENQPINCKLRVKDINEQMRISSTGLIDQHGHHIHNKSERIFPEFDPCGPCNFNGLAQGTRSNIRYRGIPPPPLVNLNLDQSKKEDKYLGYGFYYEKPARIEKSIIPSRLIPVHCTTSTNPDDIILPKLVPSTSSKFKISSSHYNGVSRKYSSSVSPTLPVISESLLPPPSPPPHQNQSQRVMLETPIRLRSILRREGQVVSLANFK